jgi:hypothetical protein
MSVDFQAYALDVLAGVDLTCPGCGYDHEDHGPTFYAPTREGAHIRCRSCGFTWHRLLPEEESVSKRTCRFDLGDRVIYNGNSAVRGTVVSFEISDHPGIPNTVTVEWDGEPFFRVMNEPRTIVDMYEGALRPEEEYDR